MPQRHVRPAQAGVARRGEGDAVAGQRRSSLRLVKQVLGTILSGFMLRPFVFLMLPGLVVLLFALYSSYWMFIHYFEAYGELVRTQAIVHPTEALRIAYQVHPHTYVFALLSLVLAIQLIGLGMLAYQAKYNHDNLFHLGSTMYRWMAESRQAPATTADTASDSSNRESRDANGF